MYILSYAIVTYYRLQWIWHLFLTTSARQNVNYQKSVQTPPLYVSASSITFREELATEVDKSRNLSSNKES